MSPSSGLPAATAAAQQPGQGPGWGAFVGGVLLGSTVAAGAAYLAVRYANSAAAADELRRGGKERRRPGRCVCSVEFSCSVCAAVILFGQHCLIHTCSESRCPHALRRSRRSPPAPFSPRRPPCPAAFSRARAGTARPAASRSPAPTLTCTMPMELRRSCWRSTGRPPPRPASRCYWVPAAVQQTAGPTAAARQRGGRHAPRAPHACQHSCWARPRAGPARQTQHSQTARRRGCEAG